MKNCDQQLENKNSVVLYIREKSKNANKRRRNDNFEKQKKCVSFSSPKDHAIRKSGSQTKRCALQPAHRHTDRVTTLGTLSGFLDFFPFNLSSRIGPITRSCFGAMVLLNKINQFQFPGLKQKQLCVAQPKQYFQKNS